MSSLQKRQSCSLCLRPLKTCICKHVQVVENKVQVIVLQHPLEVCEAKNTGRLLHLCLKNSQIYTGEVFDNKIINALPTAIVDSNDTITTTIETPIKDILLYPDNNENSGSTNEKVLATTEQNISVHSSELTSLRLWVLDATWRKSRKILHLNPWLHRMPRLSLNDCPPSIYKIRKAHSENQLSTLEASCYALRQLEQNLVNYAPIIKALGAFIAEQETFLPSR